MKRRYAAPLPCFFTALMAFFALSTLACASSPKTPHAEAGIYGMVYGRDGAPVMAALVVVDGAELALSDSGGRFFCRGVKPGTHEFEVRKKGFESYSGTFEHGAPTDVLYVKIISAAQLVDEAERAAARLDWDAALRSVERALAIEGEDPVAAFLLGVCALRHPAAADRAERAIRLLSAAAARGEREASLFLLLADLQIAKGDKEEALKSLKRAQPLRPSTEVEGRIEEMGRLNTIVEN